MARWGVLGALLGLSPLAGCKDPPPDGVSCVRPMDCVIPGTRCDLERGLCVCVTDEACEEGFFCNAAGVCQARAGCSTSSECATDAFCDLSTGQCLRNPSLALGSACGLPSHCPYGSMCVDGTCQAGCADDGDCVLGEICLDGQCFTGDGVCSDTSFCRYGEVCRGTACVDDVGFGRPYCRGCGPRTLTNPEPCDRPRNFCLINSQETGGLASFCGTDCSLEQPCANGYSCHDVVILTDAVCLSDAECQCQRDQISWGTKTCTVTLACEPRLENGDLDPSASHCRFRGHPDCRSEGQQDAAICIVRRGDLNGFCTCGHDEDCAPGAVCVGGRCCTGPVRNDRVCSFGENRVSGYCTCAVDADCPRDVCDATRGACLVTGLPCAPGSGDCGLIACVDGGCRIGRNCAPIQGLSCTVVTGD